MVAVVVVVVFAVDVKLWEEPWRAAWQAAVGGGCGMEEEMARGERREVMGIAVEKTRTFAVAGNGNDASASRRTARELTAEPLCRRYVEEDKKSKRSFRQNYIEFAEVGFSGT